MDNPPPELDVLFHEALAIQDPSKRDAFLEDACGGNCLLKDQLVALIRSHESAGDFLERPIDAPGWSDRIASGSDSEQQRHAAMDAGLSSVFREDRTLLLHSGGVSVFKNEPGRTIQLPQVILREGSEPKGGPIVKPTSSEMPARQPDSRYRLDGEIARGGMGAILKGRDVDLGRELAIKVLLETHMDRPEVVQRFIEEAQIGGQLQHPGIAPVYELGQFADQRPYFSMKLVKGETLSKLLSDRSSLDQDRGRFLGVFEQICQTMAYAHSRGVIHRDLKPANIMVGAFGEVQVMDWGLAKVLPAGGVADERKAHQKQLDQSAIHTLRSGGGSDALGADGSYGSQTQAGSIMGTPAYMPPEQAIGEIDALDERADVFGLGAILTEILTGKPPYFSMDHQQVFRMAIRGKLDDCLQRLNACGADEELVQIAKACLEPEPTARPRDASELSQRISLYITSVEDRLRQAELDRAAASARALEATVHVQTERRARRMQLALAAALLTISTLGGAAGIWSSIVQSQLKDQAVIAEQLAKTERARAIELAAREQNLAAEAVASQRREESLRIEAEERKSLIQKTLYAAEMNLAGQAAEHSTGARRVEQLIANWVPKKNETDHRGWEWGYLDSRQHSETLSALHPGGVCIAWSRDGERLYSGGRDYRIRIFDTTTGKQLGILEGHNLTIHDLSISPDGRYLASGSSDRTVRIWDLTTEALCAPIIERPTEILAISWNTDGKRLAVKSDSDLCVYDALRAECIATYPISFQDARGTDWHPNENSIAINNSVMDVETGKVKWSHPGYHAKWNPDGEQLAISNGGDLYLLDKQKGHVQSKLVGHEQTITGMAWNPKLPVLATCSNDFTVRIWNPDQSDPVATLRGHNDWLMDCEWSPDGNRLASVSHEGQIKIWRWPYQTNPSSFEFNHSHATDMVWDREGVRLGVFANHLYRWDAVNWSQMPTIHLAAFDLNSTHTPKGSWNSRRHLIVTHSDDETILVDDRNGNDLHEFPDPPGSVAHAIALNGDGSKLAITYFDNVSGTDLGFLRVYDVGTGTLEVETQKAFDIAGCIAWSPDGKRIATGRWEHAAILDATSGEVVSNALSSSDQGFIYAIAWSPDGERLAIAHWKHLVRIADSRSGLQIGTLVGHTGAVHDVDWSPDGSRIATCSEDKTVRIWDPENGAQMIVLKNHDLPVQCVAWSPSGIELASVDREGHGSVWSAGASYSRSGSAAFLSQLNKRIEADPNRLEDRRLRLSIHERLDHRAAIDEDRDFLIQAIERKLESQPEDIEASYELAKLLAQRQLDEQQDAPDALKTTNRVLKQAIQRHEVSGYEALAAAHVIAGNWDKSTALLQRLSENSSEGESVFAKALSGLALMRQGNTAASLPVAEALTRSLKDQPSSRMLPAVITIAAELTGSSEEQLKALFDVSLLEHELERLNATIDTSQQPEAFIQSRASLYARAGRWTECALDQIRLVAWSPSSRIAWAVPSSSLALSGDKPAYIAHCKKMLEHFAGTQEADVADSMCKSCLLIPEALPLNALPIDVLTDGIGDARWVHYRPWFVACRALFDYRSGDYQNALAWQGDEALETSQPGVILQLIHAMAEAKLGNSHRAKQLLEAAESSMPRDVLNLGSNTKQPSALATPESIGHDWLVAEILRREARDLLAPPASP